MKRPPEQSENTSFLRKYRAGRLSKSQPTPVFLSHYSDYRYRNKQHTLNNANKNNYRELVNKNYTRITVVL